MTRGCSCLFGSAAQSSPLDSNLWPGEHSRELNRVALSINRIWTMDDLDASYTSGSTVLAELYKVAHLFLTRPPSKTRSFRLTFLTAPGS